MLTKLWRFLFGGCEHKWRIITETKVLQADPWTGQIVSDVPIGRELTLQCEKCGDVKVREG